MAKYNRHMTKKIIKSILWIVAFYRAVVQAVLLFGKICGSCKRPQRSRYWGYTQVLRQVTGKQVRRRRYGTFQGEGDERVLKAAGTQGVHTYIDRRQATVAQWVDLLPVFEVYERETG